jgi:hypothetical protein
MPPELISLIMDYYWSHKTYRVTLKVHNEMLMNMFFKDIRCFYELYHTLTVYVEE